MRSPHTHPGSDPVVDGFTLASIESGRSLVMSRALEWMAGGAGLAAIGYITYAAAAWLRYGHPSRPSQEEFDALLEGVMPRYDVAERHAAHVHAPADVTFAAACDASLTASPIVRGIFDTRALILGSDPDPIVRPRGLLALTTSIGWRVLEENPGREVVVGAVTQPWLANVVFRPLARDEFVAFREPAYVKIAWTLRVDADGPDACVLRTETRVVTTDATARAKFRRYWAFFSAGIILIRVLLFGPIRRDAERRARQPLAASH